MLLDARSIAQGTALSCDLCIVGAGAAGIAIANRLIDADLSVLLLESGGFEPDVATQRLYRGRNIGHHYYEIDACRSRYFGGSTNRWGGWLRPFDPIEFEMHEWLDWSGWPIGDSDLRPFYGDAANILGLTNPSFAVDSWRYRLGEPLPLEDTNFENVIFQYKSSNFGELYRDRLVAAQSVTVVLNANLTRMDLAPSSSRVDALQVSTLTGRRFTVHPRSIVLATGGIENARLLLTSNRDRFAGLGNENDLVGRFFMEHLHVAAGHLIAPTRASHGDFYRRNGYDDMQVGGVIVPTSDALNRHRLLTTSITLEDASYTVGPQRMAMPSSVFYSVLGLYRRARLGRLKTAAENAKRTAIDIANLSRRLNTWKKSRGARRHANILQFPNRIYSLYFRSAQAPDPNSRVKLSVRRDALGVPEVILDWRVKSQDVDTIRSWIDILGKDMQTKDLGLVIPPLDDWEGDVIGGPHHMGTTRMSADPAKGVVDADCRVHSIDNLYVAGSSVFATGGYANPTFMIVALALRLADTLRNRLSRPSTLGVAG